MNMNMKLQKGVILTTYKSWDDPPSSWSPLVLFLKNHQIVIPPKNWGLKAENDGFQKESLFSSGYMFISHFQDPESKQSRFHGSANRFRKRFGFHCSLWKINHVMSYPATDLQFSPNYFMKNTWNQFSKMLV